jgi:hypothetical protein
MDLQFLRAEDHGMDAAQAPAEIRAPARLLEYRRGSFVAFPPHVTVGLVHRPQLVPVPGAPYFAPGLVAWNGEHIPLIDLASLLRAHPGENEPMADHVLVVGFQRGPGLAVEHGAICAPHLVRVAEVGDSQQCELPNDSDLWPLLAISCFEYQGCAVPVLDTGLLFGRAYL